MRLPGHPEPLTLVVVTGFGDERLRNLGALVRAAAHVAAVWLGEKLRPAVLCRRVAKTSKRLFGVPEFHYYALAEGIRALLSRVGRWLSPKDAPELPFGGPLQLTLFD